MRLPIQLFPSEGLNQVHGLQPIHMESMDLQGTLTARVFATGTVRLGKHSRLIDGLNAARMKMDHGAELEAVMRVGGRAGD